MPVPVAEAFWTEQIVRTIYDTVVLIIKFVVYVQACLSSIFANIKATYVKYLWSEQ